MKVTVTETREIEIDANFPIYKKTICHHAVILSENEMIVVTDSISRDIQFMEWVGKEWYMKEDCTASEFFEAYNKIHVLTEDKISKLLLEKAA